VQRAPRRAEGFRLMLHCGVLEPLAVRWGRENHALFEVRQQIVERVATISDKRCPGVECPLASSIF
jgi:hypothetical protein